MSTPDWWDNYQDKWIGHPSVNLVTIPPDHRSSPVSAIAVKSDMDPIPDRALAEAVDLMSRTIVALSEENDALKGRLD